MAAFSEDSEIPEPECQTPDNPPPEEHQPEPVLDDLPEIVDLPGGMVVGIMLILLSRRRV